MGDCSVQGDVPLPRKDLVHVELIEKGGGKPAAACALRRILAMIDHHLIKVGPRDSNGGGPNGRGHEPNLRSQVLNGLVKGVAVGRNRKRRTCGKCAIGAISAVGSRVLGAQLCVISGTRL